MTARPSLLTSIRSGLLLGIRILLGGVFLYAGLSKARHPFEFLETVYSFELVGPTFGLLVVLVLPWIEICLGLVLLAGVFLGAALLGTALLGLLFVLFQGHAIHTDLSIACGCFGASAAKGEIIDYATIIRTSALLALAAFGYALHVLMRPIQQAPARRGDDNLLQNPNAGLG